MTNTIRVLLLDRIDFVLFSFTLMNWMSEKRDLFMYYIFHYAVNQFFSFFDTIYTYALYHVI